MVYRKSPPRPPRLLLRVVAGDDAGDAGQDGAACLGLCDAESDGAPNGVTDTGGFFTDVTTPEGVVDAPPDGVADGSQEAAAAPADGGDQ